MQEFHQRVQVAIAGLPYDFTICYVDDGSTDSTANELSALQRSDGRVQVITLSRNFGHQAALSAGMNTSDAEYTISMDGDGQHPPELIAEMLQLAAQGYDIIQTQRQDSAQTPLLKQLSARIFYRLINLLGGTRILPGTADFRLLSRPALQALRAMPEYHRFLRGMVAWVGFRMVILPYEPAARLGGKTKYSLRKMLRLAADAIFSFSLMPLYLGLGVGACFFCLAGVEVLYVLRFWLLGLHEQLAPGWSSLMFALLFVGGTLMTLLGLIGMYLGYIFQEVKRRPVYIIKQQSPPSGDPPSV